MKKILIALMVVLMVGGLTACSNPFAKDEIQDVPTGEVSTDEVMQEIVNGTETESEITLDTNTEQESKPEIEETDVPENTERDVNKSFKEKHPYLFAFRFDGTNAYIDQTQFTQPENNQSGIGSTMQDTTDSYTDITADELPAIFRVNNRLSGYTLTSDRTSATATYKKSTDAEEMVTVEVVSANNINRVKKQLPSTSQYASYDFSEEEYVSTKKYFSSVQIQTLNYTLRDGTEGKVVSALICKLENGNYILIRNKTLDSNLTATVLENVYDNATEWVEE